MRSEEIVGTWTLVSFEAHGADGAISYPLGRDAIGYLMYSADGHMQVALSAADRPHLAVERLADGTVEERAEAARTFVAYGGRYTVAGDRVIHHVQIGLFPNWVGTDLERHADLSGDRLTLQTPLQVVRGRPRTARLVWQRVGRA